MEQTLIAWGTKNLNTSAQLVLAKRLGFFRQEGSRFNADYFLLKKTYLRRLPRCRKNR
jgi:hypothetical protein